MQLCNFYHYGHGTLSHSTTLRYHLTIPLVHFGYFNKFQSSFCSICSTRFSLSWSTSSILGHFVSFWFILLKFIRLQDFGWNFITTLENSFTKLGNFLRSLGNFLTLLGNFLTTLGNLFNIIGELFNNFGEPFYNFGELF